MDNKKTITVSEKNSKMGAIPSVSLPPIVTCPNCSSCAKKCYAAKLCRIYKTVRDSYNNNYDLLKESRAAYFSQIATRIINKKYSFFRWHVSGDIIDIDYLDNMCKVARQCKTTKFLAFTKNYEDVNEYFITHRKPRNLQIIFSLPFDGSRVNNPYKMPTAAVILKGQEPKPNYKICGGNCSECASCGIGCWELKKGETIAFYEH